MPKTTAIDMIGYVLPNITVLSKAELMKGGDRRWECLCGSCGKSFKARGKDLRRGDYISCGCVGRAQNATRARGWKLDHGRHGTPLYVKWKGMNHRCSNDPDYVSRGVIVCDRWKDFAAFEQDMSPSWVRGLSLERKDNLKGYEPGNCCWIPLSEQARNRSSCIRVVYDGKEMFLWAVAKILGMNRQTLSARHLRGVRPPELFNPLRKDKKQ